MDARMVYLMWHGGSSYSVPEAKDREVFTSLRRAENWFRSRVGNYQTPCVEPVPPDDGGPTGWIFFSDPRDMSGDVYPDRVMTFGPRGGVMVERC